MLGFLFWPYKYLLPKDIDAQYGPALLSVYGHGLCMSYKCRLIYNLCT